MRRRFFVPQFENGRAVLDGETAQHLARVLRAEPGQLFELSDQREVWLGKIEVVSKSRVDFALIEQIPAPLPPLRTTLLLSMVKFDRFEWCLEKATELGVSRIVPVAADRSEKRLVEAAEKRADRWAKILLESAQQSRRVAPPEMAVAAPLDKVLLSRSSAEWAILLSERAGASPLRQLLQNAKSAASATLSIGPEGGWTDREFREFQAAGFHEASLGNQILRTETAVVASLASINYALGGDS